MTMEESVLCIRREFLPEKWLGEMSAVSVTETEVREAISNSALCFLPRKTSETRFDTKQLIPYLVAYDQLHHRVGCYQRKGSEARLHGLWSIGIGGHVSIADEVNPDDWLATIHHGLHREIGEELSGLLPGKMRFLGIINEEKTAVGRVHLGLVYCLKTQRPEDAIPGSELNHFRWISIENLQKLKMEYWSTLSWNLLQSYLRKITDMAP